METFTVKELILMLMESKYVGELKDNLYDGIGKLTYSDRSELKKGDL